MYTVKSLCWGAESFAFGVTDTTFCRLLFPPTAFSIDYGTKEKRVKGHAVLNSPFSFLYSRSSLPGVHVSELFHEKYLAFKGLDT